MKVSVIGLGQVGSSLAFVLSIRSFIDELVLVGRTRESVMGDVLDLRHGQLFVDEPTRVIAGLPEDTAGSDVIAFCASVPSGPDVTDRLKLAPANVALLQEMLPTLARLSPNSKIVMISNPVDVLVHFALKITGFPPNQILGTGTLVDSARFRQLLSEDVQIHMEDIRAYILGEHGETQFPAMSCADAGGELLDPTPARYAMFKQASRGGLEVLKHKGYTNYAIAMAAMRIIECIAHDSKHTMPVSVKLDGYLGVDDICLSLPSVVGRHGVERIMHPRLSTDEQNSFHRSAEVIRKVIGQIEAGL